MISLLSVPRRFTWNLLWSIIVLLLPLHTIHFGEGHTGIIYMCYPIFVQGIICEKTFRRFQDVMLLTYSKAIFPSRISIGSTKCDHFYWGNKSHDELLFLGGMEILSSSTKRKALYTLLYLVHMIAVCSVVGLIAAVLLYIYCSTGTKMNKIAFGHCLIAYHCPCCIRGHRSRTIIGATWVRGQYRRHV